MEKAEIKATALEAMVLINAAITNIRLYPPASNLITISIDKAHSTLSSIFDHTASIVFAETEKSLLVLDEPLSEKDQQKPQVVSVLDMMLNFGIKSLGFEKGLGQDEFRTFLVILSKKPEDVDKEGGLQQVVESNNLQHVLVDQKVYVSVQKDQQIVSGLDIKDADFLKFIMGDKAGPDIDPEKVKEMAKDPEWMSQVVQSSLKQITEEKGTAPDSTLSESFSKMIRTLDGVTDKENKEKFLQHIATSLADMDDDVIRTVLSQNLEGNLKEDLIGQLTGRLGDEKVKQLEPHTIGEEAPAEIPAEAPAPSDDERRSGDDRRKKHSAEYFAQGGVERRKTEDQRKHRAARVKAGLNSLLKGETDVFEDKEVMLSLPMAIRQLYTQENVKAVEAIFSRLNNGLSSENPDVRIEIFQVLSIVCVNLVSDGKTELFLKLSYKLIPWLKFETSMTAPFQLICSNLAKLAQSLILNRRFIDTNHVIEAFQLIYSGKIKKGEAIQTLAGNTLNGLMTDEVLGMILREFLADESQKQWDAGNTLAMLGAASVAPISDVFKRIPDAQQRDRMLQVAAGARPPAAPEEMAHLQERICAILDNMISQNAIPEPMLAAVQNSLSALKSPAPEIPDAATPDVTPAPETAIESEATVPPAAQDAPPAEETMADAVEQALDLLIDTEDQPETHPPQETDDAIPSEAVETAVPESKEPVDEDIDSDLQRIDEFVGQDDTASAVKLLFDLIVKNAKAKDFSRAEMLREKLFDVDPMALTEIVESGEIIEKEKSEAIDQDHLELWTELYGALSDEEANTLYFAKKEVEYDTDQTVFKQGKPNDNLYFINQGQLKMVYHLEEEILIDTLDVGGFVGTESFFNLTVCTTSVITTTPSTLVCLNKNVLPKWQSDFPALRSRLRDYCLKKEKTVELLKEKGLDRRAHPRQKVRGRVAFQLLDASGKPVDKAIQEDIEDISRGGISFFTKIAKETVAQRFFGQNVAMQFALQTGSTPHKVRQNGRIVCVLNHLASDYSIHVKFGKMLDEKIIASISAPEDTDG
ncbi:Crp/Fnr family transcriptional regulator [Thermodesulfobacteriota bacterium]